MLPLPTPAELRRRLPRLVGALIVMGVGISLMVHADVGLGPWDVLHQGISDRTGIPIGTVGIAVGFVVMLGWIPLRERPGLGTLLNIVVIGVTIDLLLPRLPEVDHLVVRALLSGVGILLWGLATGVYIGVRMGPGPRDGLMTAIAARGPAVWKVRTAIEVSALAVGFALGGTVGPATLVFAFGMGPVVQWSLQRWTLPPLATPVGPSPAAT